MMYIYDIEYWYIISHDFPFWSAFGAPKNGHDKILAGTEGAREKTESLHHSIDWLDRLKGKMTGKSPCFMGKSMVSCRCSLQLIH